MSYFKMLVFVLALVCQFSSNSSSSNGQSIEDLFPDENIKLIDFTAEFPYEVIFDRNILGLSIAQQEELRILAAKIDFARSAAGRLEMALGADYRGPKYNDFKGIYWEEFMSLMDERQLLRLAQFNLVRLVEWRSKEKWDLGLDSDLPLQEFIFSSGFSNWLGVNSEQLSQLLKAQEEAVQAMEKLNAIDPEKVEAELFHQWQAALFERLLPHQQSLFEDALGEEAAYMKPFFNKVYVDPRIFLIDPSDLDFEAFSTTDVEKELGLGHRLNLTHPHIDAKIHPHALFDLLLTKEVVNDLKLNHPQIDFLNSLREDWFNEESKPDQISVDFEVGRNMTTQAMKESVEDFREKFCYYHDHVEQILTSKQLQRLRQLGNQFLMSRGWKEVPLTCPEWNDYLALSKKQQSEFEKINQQFRANHERIEEEINDQLKKVGHNLEEKISRILTEKQKTLLLEFIAIRGY